MIIARSGKKILIIPGIIISVFILSILYLKNGKYKNDFPGNTLHARTDTISQINKIYDTTSQVLVGIEDKDENTKVDPARNERDKELVPGQVNQRATNNHKTGFVISFIIVTITLILVLLFAAYVKRLEKKMHG